MVGSTPDSSAQILVVEDELEIRELISLLLLRSGYRVQQCSNASEAIEHLKKNKFDLMVLDWMMPSMSGIELLKAEIERPPVLMVTAKTEPRDIVQGLEAGADDYITKPFEPAVFSARVKALLRRGFRPDSAKATSADMIKIGDLTINATTYEVTCCGQKLHLTPSEFKIMHHMALNQGRVMTRDYLIEVVQGEGISVTGRTIDTHVFGLRKKLADCADCIETIRGVGYRIKQAL